MTKFAVWLLALSVTDADIASAAPGHCTDNNIFIGNSFCVSNFFSSCLGNMKRLKSRECDNPFKDIKVGSNAAPVFVDWDGDRDLDLAVGNGDGKLMYYEHLGANTSLLSSGNVNPFKDIDVGKLATPAFLDGDGDGDLDLVVGNSDGKLQYFERINDSTLSPSTGSANPFHWIDFKKDAVPAFVDWDGDDDLDLAVGSHDWTFGHQIRYFEHAQNGSWLEQKDSQNPFQGLRHSSAALVFADWNGDGNLNVLLGYANRVNYYERSGLTLAKYERNAHPMSRIDQKTSKSLRPAVVDWDGDGDLDLIIGDSEGKLKYFESSDTSSFSDRTGLRNPFGAVDVGWGASSVFVDLNEDGVLDLAVGNGEGKLKYYEHIDDTLSPRTGKSNPFNSVDVGKHAVPAFADWDGDAVLDLAVGNKNGALECYQRAQNNTFVLTNHSNPCQGIHVGSYSAPAFLDWDGDLDLDLAVGNGNCKLQYFERTDNSTWLPRTGRANPFHRLSFGSKGCKNKVVPSFVDWDSDGDLHLVAHTGNGQLRWWQNTGKKLIKWAKHPLSELGIGNGRPAFGDWDGDSDLDIAVGDRGQIQYYLHGCEHANPCNLRGQCTQSGHCQCLDGYAGAANCGVCSPGFNSSNTGAFFCTRCDPGRFSASLGRECSSCPNGKYSTRGSSSCKYCLDGAAPHSNQSDCFECAPGKYAYSGMDSCSACPPGNQSGRGSSFCSRCIGGTVTSSSQSSCLGCSPGKYASTGMDTCMPCPAGKYSLTAYASCSPCKAGRYSNAESSDCTPCAEGLHASLGSSACYPCKVLSKPSGDSSRCERDLWLLFLLVSCSGIQLYATYSFFRRVGFGIRLVDVSSYGESVVITTFMQHCLSSYGFIRVHVSGTHHFKLDGRNFLARSLDGNRLELLDENANKIGDDMQASMGVLTLPLCQELLAICKQNPQRILLLPVPWLYARSLTPLQVRHNAYKKELSKENPRPVRCDPGPQRAVTLRQIRSLLLSFHDYIKNRNAYYLDANVLRPITKHARLSFAEFAGPNSVTYFVSHFWGTPFAHFVEAIERHASHHVRESLRMSQKDAASGALAYWVCFLSNNQWRLGEEVGDWKESSFFKALWSNTCKGTCMVLDTDALPLTRAWCLFEVLQTFRRQEHDASENQFQGLVFCTDTGVMGPQDKQRANEKCYDVAIGLADRLAELDVRDATASVKSDEDMIKSLIDEDGGMDNMNSFIRTSMCQALAEVQRGFSERAQRLQSELAPSLEKADSPDEMQAGVVEQEVVPELEWHGRFSL